VIRMLDTDSVSFALRGEGRVAERIRSQLPSQIAVSSITAAELWFGVERRRSDRLRRLVGTFLDAVSVRAFDATAAQHYGRLAASLRGSGRPIGIADTMIAAHALAGGFVLVTHNATHFHRIRGLRIEDWY
jgi:tRNA(fMet)-specific endonuclease VapC